MVQMILGSVAAPFVVTAICAALALLLASRGKEAIGAGLVAIGIGAGYVVASATLVGAPRVPMVDARSWLFVYAIAAALVGASDAMVARRVYTWSALLAFALWVPAGMLEPRMIHAWDLPTAIGASAALAASLLAAGVAYRSLSETARPSLLAALLAAGAGALAVMLLLSGSALLGQLAGALACALAAAFMFSFLPRADTWQAGLVVPSSVLVVGLAAAGLFYADLPVTAALSALASPVLAGLASAPTRRRLPPAAAWIVVALVGVVPLLAGLGIAYAGFEPPSDDPYGAY